MYSLNRLVRIFARHMVMVIFVAAGPIYAADAPADQLTTYPAPDGVALNDDFTVKVRTPGHEWQNVASYLVKVDVVGANGHNPLKSSIAYFDFAGTVDVSITANNAILESVRVRPLSYGIKPEV